MSVLMLHRSLQIVRNVNSLSPIQGHHDELEGIVALLKGQIEDLQRQLQEAETLNVRLQAR